VETVKLVSEVLSKCPEVKRFDDGEHNEAWALAGSFADLEDTMRAFLDEYLPKLAEQQLKPSEVCKLLLDIGEEFRHMLYHILEQQSFYKYLHQGSDCQT
jgi:hypothetical protein